MGYSIRNERFRYTIWIKWSGKLHGYAANEKPVMDPSTVYAEELYDYVKDPDETVNVVNQPEYKQDLNTMKTYWNEFAKKYVNTNPTSAGSTGYTPDNPKRNIIRHKNDFYKQ
jgi:hypothetical protein